MDIGRITKKFGESGVRGVLAAAARQTVRRLDGEPKAGTQAAQLWHQSSAHRTLARYTTFEGKNVLEVGGAQTGDSAIPFLEDGASSAVVTGLDHITQEATSDQFNLRVQRADALELVEVFGSGRFDVVYGLSIVEHIPRPELFLEQVHAVLKPGGLAYLQGDPIWSSPQGHHLWVATWGGDYRDKATANYLFNGFPGQASTNPLPDWGHLLMSPDEMKRYLEERAIPAVDIDCIIDWVFRSSQVNRIGMSEIARAYSGSRLSVLEAIVRKVDVPKDTLAALRRRCGDGVDYGATGVTYVLAKTA